LLLEEFNEIYDRAPKFPDGVEPVAGGVTTERIDVDSFVQVYRDIDDLFETDNESVNASSTSNSSSSSSASPLEKQQVTTTTALSSSTSTIPDATTQDETTEVESDAAPEEELEEEIDEPDESLEAELESIYESICDDVGLVSKEQLRAWDEIAKLLADGLLGEDEFTEIWDATAKASTGGAEEKLDVDGFLSFNVALDDLFVFNDDEMDDVEVPLSEYSDVPSRQPALSTTAETTVNDDDGVPRDIDGTNLTPDVLFVSLANADGLVGLEELKRWGELKQMIADGDLLESELVTMFQAAKKSEMDLNKVEEEGFVDLYKAIDSLFEEDVDVMADDEIKGRRQVSRKEELLDAIADLNGDEVLPCGLDATELEQREILSIVEMIESEPTNLIRSKAIYPQELSGEWELLYSSSSAMKFNKGLSGLGGSIPNGRFGNLKQKLVATKQLTDVEYVERIEMTPSTASFDVRVTGTWDLRTSVSLFTGEPSMVMNVIPDRVIYGPTSTRADHWKSLGPLNMLDITYLDEDLRIMRGNTSVDTIFVFRRTQ
jgi:PAP_fibrillin